MLEKPKKADEQPKQEEMMQQFSNLLSQAQQKLHNIPSSLEDLKSLATWMRLELDIAKVEQKQQVEFESQKEELENQENQESKAKKSSMVEGPSKAEHQQKLEEKKEHAKTKVEQLKNYKFEDFVRDFKRSWQPGTEEWKKREDIFTKNLNAIISHHQGPTKAWSQDINKFMDYTKPEFEKMLGHKGSRRGRVGAGSLMQKWGNSTEIALPKVHDWKVKTTRSSSFMRDQGACGSCWAFAAVEAMEHHLEIAHGKADKLSPQFLVSCMPNELHCGGTGGCQGATANLAFDYVKENGIPSESHWPYTSFSGRNGVCNERLKSTPHIRIETWEHLPVNEDAPLAKALYEHGPVVVSVDGSPWSFYEGGIFAGCEKDTVINHAVLAVGFGEEVSEKTQKLHKYYLIKNSWGRDWGEDGHIRLERFEDSNAYCGIDTKPEEGNGCDGGPHEIPVCGMCGVTSDSSLPVGAKFVETDLNPAEKAATTGSLILKKGFEDLIK